MTVKLVEVRGRLQRCLLSCCTALLLLPSAAAGFESAGELYRACRMFQGTRLDGMAEKMSRGDVLKAGQCAGYAHAWPTAFMFGTAAATQTPTQPSGRPTPPGCYQPTKTKTGDLVDAIVRRYERDPQRIKDESAEMLMLLAFRDELPCVSR